MYLKSKGLFKAKSFLTIGLLISATTLKGQIPADVTKLPYAIVCRVIKSNNRVATGFLIAKNMMLTNAHVTKELDSLDSITIIPGYRSTGTKSPYGKIVVRDIIKNENVFIPKEYVGTKKNPTPTHDYSLVLFNAPEVINQLDATFGEGNYFDLAIYDNTATIPIEEVVLTISGYPGWRWFDRLFCNKKRGNQYVNTGKLRSRSKGILHYRFNTRGGSSGSPLWMQSNDGRKHKVVAIHRAGFKRKNSGVEITQKVYNQIEQWKKEISKK